MDMHEIKARDLQVGDRLSRDGLTRVAAIHPKKDDRVLAQTKHKGSRSPSISTWHPDATVKVWR